VISDACAFPKENLHPKQQDNRTNGTKGERHCEDVMRNATHCNKSDANENKKQQ
jgi:hypothetical protein